jgi:hypothetical protein
MPRVDNCVARVVATAVPVHQGGASDAQRVIGERSSGRLIVYVRILKGRGRNEHLTIFSMFPSVMVRECLNMETLGSYAGFPYLAHGGSDMFCASGNGYYRSRGLQKVTVSFATIHYR